MAENYLDILEETIRNNWDQPALTEKQTRKRYLYK